VPVVWPILGKPIVPVEGTDEQIHLAYELLGLWCMPRISGGFNARASEVKRFAG
jgi:hypothetical protein